MSCATDNSPHPVLPIVVMFMCVWIWCVRVRACVCVVVCRVCMHVCTLCTFNSRVKPLARQAGVGVGLIVL